MCLNGAWNSFYNKNKIKKHSEFTTLLVSSLRCVGVEQEAARINQSVIAPPGGEHYNVEIFLSSFPPPPQLSKSLSTCSANTPPSRDREHGASHEPTRVALQRVGVWSHHREARSLNVSFKRQPFPTKTQRRSRIPG